jgi:hypothetical protein
MTLRKTAGEKAQNPNHRIKGLKLRSKTTPDE